MEKRGVVNENSLSDIDHTKKAAYYDENSHLIVDEANKNKLKNPKPIKDLNKDVR